MEQVSHFLEESDVLYELVLHLDAEAFEVPTQFKNWTLNDILVHLHFWNRGADLSLNDPGAFANLFEALSGALKTGRLREHENANVFERGTKLVSLWHDHTVDMAQRWRDVDPKTRVKWAGPDMSVRSSISARQMEIWAHGQAVFDMAGKDRPESDRIQNIVRLGVNAFGWSHTVHGLQCPQVMPTVSLISPSGANWVFGDGENTIEGSAVEFCQVVTQTRNIADTGLQVSGSDAQTWMEYAQCFAGPPNMPPAPGVRHKVKA